jgi:hypothetical protein
MTKLENLRALYEMIQPDNGYDGGTAILTAEELGLLLDLADAVNGLAINYATDKALERLNEEVESDS